MTGPVRVLCSRPVVSSLRTVYQNSFTEIMEVSQPQLNKQWYFPWYDHAAMQTWVLIANPSGALTATCTISIAGAQRSSHSIAPYGVVAPTYSSCRPDR